MRCELLKKSFSLKLDSVKDIRFSSVLYFFISKQISKSLSLRASTPESHEIEDFVEAELVPQTDKASPRCPQSVLACGFKSHFPHQCKGHSFFKCPLFLYLSKSANHYH